MSLISVVIPTHNRTCWLGDAIESVVNQTHTDWELIVVDDGSDEDIGQFIKQRFPALRYTLLRNENATSPGFARNTGTRQAKGEYLAFLDSDDVWYPTKLADQLCLFNQPDGEKVGFVGGACDYMDIDGKPIMEPSFPPKSATYEDFVFKIKMPGSGSNNLIRKRCFDEVGGFREDLQRAEDKLLWLQLLSKFEVRYVDLPTATIRIHPTTRVNVNEKILLENRLSVDNEVKDPLLRRKAKAFTHFVLYTRNHRSAPALAYKELFVSFLVYPFSISDEIKRLRTFVSNLLNR